MMITILKTALFGGITCALLSLTACQHPTIQENPSPAGLQAAELEEHNPCGGAVGQYHFDLETSNDINVAFPHQGTIYYYTYLGDYPPYVAGKTCMCEIQHYAI